MFWASHTEHHKFTLHPPDDLEVVLPMQVTLRSFLQHGIVSPWALWGTLRGTFRLACGIVEGEWANILFPADEPEKRRDLINWARLLLIGHGALVIVSLALGWWMVPVVVTLAPFYGGWFQPLLNHAQHVGLQDNVPDFRLCCRTITLNPFVQFLYWHMNFHTEHHMFAAVPCYNLPRLHRLIRHDLPPCPHGVIATWREIIPILRRQKIEPGYQYVAPLPPPRTTTTGHSSAAGAGAANGAAASCAG
jgi:fatty acid desaturase